jgi:hypothetical protein
MVGGRSFQEPLTSRRVAIARLQAVLVVAVLGALMSCVLAVAAMLPLPAGHRSTEAHVAVDPTDPKDMLVLARDEDGGPLARLRMWRSDDGGQTFRGGMLVDGRRTSDGE